MKKIYSVLITIILLLNSINVIAIDSEVSKALANTREEYSGYIEKAIEYIGIDKDSIETEHIFILIKKQMRKFYIPLNQNKQKK